TYSPSVPKAGENVTFDASLSDDPDGTIANYEWNFGDGTPLDYGMIVNHTYATNGTYPVVLTVTDNDTLTNSTTLDVTVIDYPVANFTVSPGPPYYAPATLTFNASLSTPNGGFIVNYTWSFGDGNVTTVTNPIINHTYTTNGTYTVILNVTDSEGLWNTTSKDITVDRRDVAVIAVWVEYPLGANQTTGIYPGWEVNITVTVRNNGTVTENFGVTVYYENATASFSIDTLPVTGLAPGNETTLKFSWNTTGVAYSFAPYTINATASTVPYEMNTTNNNLITTIGVKMPGDVDWSGHVDYTDLWALGAAYGASYGEPRYDPCCDFNGNGEVDYRDLWTLGSNYST
ncbi:MAG: PKD domain-containing protein, partial [Desulfobacterales bacterium]|nr:PKD domain-containing protein [Desulfobacterales bacterium]